MTGDNRPDRQAWMLAVLDRYEGPLTRYAARLVGDVECARDVVQETFLRFCSDQSACQDLASRNGHLDDAGVGPWLFAVCRNRAIDVLRKEKPMKTMQANTLSAVTESATVDAARSPSADLEHTEAVDQLHAIVADLPDNQQEALRLRFQNEMSYQQISEVMQTSVGNVGYLLHHAIKTVRKQLAINPSANTRRRKSS
jgi:RNA polymerase sigma-70 factor (ECF subfamily)